MRIMTDSPIRFPGLFGDWEFTASSTAFHIGGKAIYWYGILIALGVVLALWFCMTQKEKYGITEDDLLDAVLWGIPLSIVGARLYYVIFYLDLLKLGALTDLIVMGFLIGQAVGRWGNFMNREAFGTETTMPWRMELTTTLGQTVDVHPTFLYESLWNVIGLLLIVFIVAKGRRFDGENTWFYFLWYGIGRFWIEGLRTDSLYLFNWTIGGEPIRVSQALSLVMVLVAAFMLFYNIRLHPHKPEELYVNMAAAKKAAAETKDETPAEGA